MYFSTQLSHCFYSCSNISSLDKHGPICAKRLSQKKRSWVVRVLHAEQLEITETTLDHVSHCFTISTDCDMPLCFHGFFTLYIAGVLHLNICHRKQTKAPLWKPGSYLWIIYSISFVSIKRRLFLLLTECNKLLIL